MQKSVITFFGLLLPASAFASVNGSNNQVTLSGTITQATTPVRSQNASTIRSVSKLSGLAITNAAVLDAMVQAGLLRDKTGYSLVERFSSGATPVGFYAANTKTGSEVAVPANVLSPVLSASASGAAALSGSMKIGTPSSLTSESLNFIFAGSGNFLSTVVSTYLTGSRALVVKSSNRTVTYEAVLRGVIDGNRVIDLKLVSKNPEPIIDSPPTGGGEESGFSMSNISFPNLPAPVGP